MRKFEKSHKLDNVCYDIRGPVMDEANRMIAQGTEILKLNNIRDNPGARHRRKIVGRGIGSGKGKTSGRGGKGQTARSGVSLGGFEGGQTPIYRRMPKRGFKNPCKVKTYELDFIKISRILKKGLLAENEVIDRDFLIKIGYMPKYIKNISLLANGTLDKPVKVCVYKATEKAREILKKSGSVLEETAKKQVQE